jgi:hypothetical protein
MDFSRLSLAGNVMVMMQQQVSEKAEHKPNGSFEDSLEPGRHQQRIRLRRSECQFSQVLRRSNRALQV